MFIGRMGADIILRVAWNCARRALTDIRPLVADGTSELIAGLTEAFVVEFTDGLLLSYSRKKRSLK